MDITLTPAQEALILQAIASGRYQTAEDVVRDAMTHWEAAERARMEMRLALEEAEADLEAALYTDYTSATISRLAEEMKRGEARARHAREQILNARNEADRNL